jgi:hypothetical protein
MRATYSSASSMIVRLRSPRKSNLTSPTASRRRPCRTATPACISDRRRRVERAEVGELAGRDEHAAGVHADVAGQASSGCASSTGLDGFARPPPVSIAPHLRLHLVAPSFSETGLAPSIGISFDRRRTSCRADRARGRRRAPPPSRPSCRRWRSGSPRPCRTLAHVLDDAVAVVLTEVDVEVGHRHPLRDSGSARTAARSAADRCR